MLVEFTNILGSKVYVNAKHVISVVPYCNSDNLYTICFNNKDNNTIVQEEIKVLISKLNCNL